MTKTSGECGFREKQRSGGSGGGREVDSGGCRGDGRWRWTGKNRVQVLSILKASLQGTSSSITNGGESLSRELRVVPSGPDPLHHNGGNVPP